MTNQNGASERKGQSEESEQKLKTNNQNEQNSKESKRKVIMNNYNDKKKRK